MELSKRTNSRKIAVEKLYSYEISGDVDYENTDEYSLELISGVIAKKEEIDEIISKCLINYTINRLNYVDLSIIRVATYELIKGTPAPVVINEAINLTKIYSNLDDDKAKAFNNKLLDNISKYLANR